MNMNFKYTSDRQYQIGMMRPYEESLRSSSSQSIREVFSRNCPNCKLLLEQSVDSHELHIRCRKCWADICVFCGKDENDGFHKEEQYKYIKCEEPVIINKSQANEFLMRFLKLMICLPFRIFMKGWNKVYLDYSKYQLKDLSTCALIQEIRFDFPFCCVILAIPCFLLLLIGFLIAILLSTTSGIMELLIYTLPAYYINIRAYLIIRRAYKRGLSYPSQRLSKYQRLENSNSSSLFIGLELADSNQEDLMRPISNYYIL